MCRNQRKKYNEKSFNRLGERRNYVMTGEEFLQLTQSLIWLLAGVGVFIVGMNFMGDALEKSAAALDGDEAE